jgi:SAM-dependent methyltransferase
MIVGEAGAGDGYFTLPMARRVGSTGAVYANDISSGALQRLAASARRDGLPNVHTVEGDTDDPRFPRRDLDLVVIVHAFHDFSKPVPWLRNVKKYLKPQAAVVIIDCDPSQGAEAHFWSRERILGYAERAGFEPVKVVDDISRHLIIVLKPGGGSSLLSLLYGPVVRSSAGAESSARPRSGGYPTFLTGPRGLNVTKGSACRQTTFQSAPSRRKTVVTRKSNGEISSSPPTFAFQCSTSKRVTRSAVRYIDIVS